MPKYNLTVSRYFERGVCEHMQDRRTIINVDAEDVDIRGLFTFMDLETDPVDEEEEDDIQSPGGGL